MLQHEKIILIIYNFKNDSRDTLTQLFCQKMIWRVSRAHIILQIKYLDTQKGLPSGIANVIDMLHYSNMIQVREQWQVRNIGGRKR